MAKRKLDVSTSTTLSCTDFHYNLLKYEVLSRMLILSIFFLGLLLPTSNSGSYNKPPLKVNQKHCLSTTNQSDSSYTLPPCTLTSGRPRESPSNFLVGKYQKNWWTRETVRKLDDFVVKKNHQFYRSIVSQSRQVVHFVLIGDSRIRQHFLNILKIIPNYDLKFEPKFMSSYMVQEDMNVTSNVLNLKISFYFRRWLTTDTTEILLRLLQNPRTDVSRVILIGISLHHMLDGNGSVNFEQYRKNLTAIKPILENLISCQNTVLWMNQYPSIDIFGPLNSHLEVFSEKIHHYNLATEKILWSTGVILWSSRKVWVEEYIRSCILLERADNWRSSNHFGHAYFNCLDYVHPGYTAVGEIAFLILSEVYHLLIQHIH